MVYVWIHFESKTTNPSFKLELNLEAKSVPMTSPKHVRSDFRHKIDFASIIDSI
jgi:hypothetical protein